jgi:succinate dehydrogenase/fumarate reductase iron-sulfur protein
MATTGSPVEAKAQDAYTAAQAAQDASAKHDTRSFKIWRGEGGKGEFVEYKQDVVEGMVVLDAVHEIQATQANDLAVRWNCKAGKCGSCSAEINGMPKLMCMTRLEELDATKPITVEPMRAFPHMRDLVTDVSWNFEVKKKIRSSRRESRTRPMERGGWSKPTSIAFRNSESASSAFCVRTSATCCATTPSTTSLLDQDSWCTQRRWRCIRSTQPTACQS